MCLLCDIVFEWFDWVMASFIDLKQHNIYAAIFLLFIIATEG